MSILYDEAQEAIGLEARRVLDARMDKARLLELLLINGEYDEQFWQTAIEQGWTGLALPEAHGGLDLGLIELGLIAQAAGAVTAGAPFLTTNYGAGQLLLASGDSGLQQAWLPRLATGEAIGAVALAEAASPLPDVPNVEFADGALTGSKPGVAAGCVADFVIVWAQQGGSPVLVLVELEDGLRQTNETFDNSRLYADLTFDATPAALVLSADAARDAARDTLARMAVIAAHEQLGGAEAAMLTARDFANERKAFGQPIGAFQSVKHRIAELYGLVEIARANCIHAASLEGQPGFLEAAACARISATEAYDGASRDAMQIHGGTGVTWDTGLHLHSRRARSLAIEMGNLLFWEDVLVDELAGASA